MLSEGRDNMNYARWATKEEVVERLMPVNLTTSIDKVGTPITYDDKFLYIDQKECHNIVIGSTGSGKTQVNILPTIRLAMKAEQPFVVNDPKGEIYSILANQLKKENYNIVLLNFDDATYGNNWNPLELAYKMYSENKDKAVKLLEDLGYYLFFDPKDNSDPFWVNSTIDYFTGLALYLFENASKEEIHLESICNISNSFGQKGAIEQFLEKLDRNTNIYLNLVGTLAAPPETRGSILSVFNQKMKKYISRENLSNMLSSNDFDICEISNQKTALFIVNGHTNYCDNLIPLLVNQIVEAVNFYGKKEKTLSILLDEFDNMIPIKDFVRLIEFSRSIRVKFTVVVRSYKHLLNMYSKEDTEILKMCFGNIIYLLSTDIYTLEEISNYCGMQLVDGKTVPLVTPEELKTMEVYNAIMIMPRMMPFKTKLLPDYKIDWGYETDKAVMPLRTKNDIKRYQI